MKNCVRTPNYNCETSAPQSDSAQLASSSNQTSPNFHVGIAKVSSPQLRQSNANVPGNTPNVDQPNNASTDSSHRAATVKKASGQHLLFPSHWSKQDYQILVQRLDQLPKADLVKALACLLNRGNQHRQNLDHARNMSRGSCVVAPQETPSSAEVIDLGPEYTTNDIAEMCGISRQAIVQRVHKLIANGWLEERYTKRWTFDDGESTVILANPRKPR